VLKRDGLECNRQAWQINGLGWNDITEFPVLGTTEIWRFINDSGVSHPMHMHLVMFQVLDRDGFTKGPGGEIIPNGTPQAPPAEENGWKDTAMVAPNQILRIITRFEGYKGKYPYHCHILEHEEHEMMRQFQTISCGDGELDRTEQCDYGNTAPWDGCSAGCDFGQYVELAGLAVGGGAQLTIAGVVIGVPTTPGQTPAQIAAALAAAINANPTLQALGLVAIAVGNRVYVNGSITSVVFGDAGLTNPFRLTVGPELLWWSSVPAATGYDLVRGDLPLLQSSAGNFTTATQACLANNSTPTSLPFASTPAIGGGWWFVLRAATSGGPGTYNDGSPSQVGSRDAEINAAAASCP